MNDKHNPSNPGDDDRVTEPIPDIPLPPPEQGLGPSALPPSDPTGPSLIDPVPSNDETPQSDPYDDPPRHSEEITPESRLHDSDGLGGLGVGVPEDDDDDDYTEGRFGPLGLESAGFDSTGFGSGSFESRGFDSSEFERPSIPVSPSPALPEVAESELEGLRYDATGLPAGPRRVLPLEPEPSPLVSRYLFPTEKYRGEWRRHWVHLLPQLLIGVIATFVMGYFSGLFARMNADAAMGLVVVLWLAVLGYIGWRVLDWYFDRFILTNKRVMVVSGIITRHVAMMPLLRVTDMKYEQSPIGRILNYGTFVLESAGQEQALREVNHLPNPNELYLRVCEEMYEPEAVEARLGAVEDEEDAWDPGY